jgi:hypothetical protein
MIQIKTIKYVTSLDSFNDVVIQLDWEYSLEGFQTISGTLELPAPSSETFIPIEDLEQSIMVEWVEKLVNPEQMELQQIKEEEVIISLNINNL